MLLPQTQITAVLLLRGRGFTLAPVVYLICAVAAFTTLTLTLMRTASLA